MRRALLLLLAFLCLSVLCLSCGYTSPSGATNTTGLNFRAFVTQDVSGGNVFAAVNIVDTQRDLLSLQKVINAGVTPGMMVVTPSRNQTLVFSKADLTLSLINNATENNAAHTTLPGATQSIVVSPDSSTAFVAVPTAQVAGQSPGTVEVVNMSNAAFTAQVDIPAVRYLSISHNGTRILGFSDNSDSVAVITPSNIGTGNPVVTFVGGFDRPVQAFFSSDDTIAYVVNCGAECGGSAPGLEAGVEILDMTSDTAGTAVGACAPGSDPPQCAASTATVVGTSMYLAGTPYSNGAPSLPCTGQQTQAQSCGLLTVVDLPTMTVTNSSPIIITDGYHDHIAMGANGQLFVGGHDCTEIRGSETRGCLAIYNTQSGAVVVPPASGDVTGLQPITNRNVVYLVQNGELQIYDTATDKLQARQVDISGQAVDVKAVDQ